jgi:hypothetical protein
VIPGQYRTVAVTDVPVPLDEAALRGHLVSRDAYRRTRYVVARRGGEVVVVELLKAGESELFEEVLDLRLLAGPEETVLLERPDVDTAVPSQLAMVAARDAPGKRCVVVHGRYEHVNFVIDSEPGRVHVLDVAPPWPAKLVDQVVRVVDTAEELAPTVVVPEVVDLQELVDASPPAEHYLMPCRGGGIERPDAQVSYLDEVPPAADWLLIGCARSRAIHDHFYPDLADGVRQVDVCPLTLAGSRPLPPGEVRLTKCCQLEEHVETRDDTVVVPWGASFVLVREGLAAAASLAKPGGPEAVTTP